MHRFFYLFLLFGSSALGSPTTLSSGQVDSALLVSEPLVIQGTIKPHPVNLVLSTKNILKKHSESLNRDSQVALSDKEQLHIQALKRVVSQIIELSLSFDPSEIPCESYLRLREKLSAADQTKSHLHHFLADKTVIKTINQTLLKEVSAFWLRDEVERPYELVAPVSLSMLIGPSGNLGILKDSDHREDRFIALKILPSSFSRTHRYLNDHYGPLSHIHEPHTTVFSSTELSRLKPFVTLETLVIYARAFMLQHIDIFPKCITRTQIGSTVVYSVIFESQRLNEFRRRVFELFCLPSKACASGMKMEEYVPHIKIAYTGPVDVKIAHSVDMTCSIGLDFLAIPTRL